jgi:MoCo/4Fe-4S cofactor protein with predicted Tat translocation signal
LSDDHAKRYWKNLRERDGDPDFLRGAQSEFPQELDRPALQVHRRDFLKVAGFGAAATVLAGCSRAPVEKAIPMLVQPEEIIPGRALHYASTCAGCNAGCGLLVKNRDGRPIKLEGNAQQPLSRGGLCAVGQASILGLYDSQRFKAPQKAGKDSAWAAVDGEIMGQLEKIRAENGAVRFLSGSLTSPTARAAIAAFLKPFADARHVVYDPISSSAVLDAHERTHGVRLLPHYRFDQAEVIVSFDADFLATWISPVEFTAGYRAGRNLEARPPRLSWHAQFEPRMSLTGSKADLRRAVAPSDMSALLTGLAARLAVKAGLAAAVALPRLWESSDRAALLDELAGRLWAARGRSLVVGGSNDVNEQVLINFINHALDNYGVTLDLEHPSYQAQGSDRDLAALLEELKQGKVAALFLQGVNPAYDIPTAELAAALQRVSLVVSFAPRADETAALAHYVCPEPHALESWDDAEPIHGLLSLTQPVIRPLFQTRPLVESLATWSGAPRVAYDNLRDRWQREVFPRQSREKSFDSFWDHSVEAGFAEVEAPPLASKPFDLAAVRPLPQAPRLPRGSFALVLYPKIALRDGRHAYNPWLQELPDPISKVAWDNYASLSPAAAARLGVEDGDTVTLDGPKGAASLVLPVFVQPGQHDQVVAVALGYGSRLSARFAKAGPQWIEAQPTLGPNGLVGTNLAPWLQLRDGALRYSGSTVRVSRAGQRHPLASTQIYGTLTVPANLAPPGGKTRPLVEETTLPVFLKKTGSPEPHKEEKADLWPSDHPYSGHRWAMAIDLTACTGCSACVVSCQAENNIPVVGRDEIRRNREMHWLRIDRYYSESPSGEVDVAYQPMMCQQCDHAPCETVCPVLATVHSEEGLNMQVYNRCVGTRYCANNCPYKARRFNWFDYAHDDQLQNLVLNPDVTVRSRGVMEKCTFCVQRIQEAKIEAKREGRSVADGEIQPACQQSCPAQAIVFGDLNDPKSRVTQLAAGRRAARVLEELNVRPSVAYLNLVRNREGGEGKDNG